jgi:hypothetical protein
MGNYQKIISDPSTGVPFNTASRLTRSFLDRHGTGLEDLLRRFPSVQGATFRAAIERCLVPGTSVAELRIALEEAFETLLSLKEEDFRPLPVDAGRRTNVDAGIRWYAARLRDLAKASQRM